MQIAATCHVHVLAATGAATATAPAPPAKKDDVLYPLRHKYLFPGRFPAVIKRNIYGA